MIVPVGLLPYLQDVTYNGDEMRPDKVEAFMQEFESLTQPVGSNRVLSRYGNYGVFGLTPHAHSGDVNLDIIMAWDKGIGNGSIALQWLLSLADKHGVDITGRIERQGDNGLSTVELRRWYKRHGFKVDRQLYMRREASTNKPNGRMKDA